MTDTIDKVSWLPGQGFRRGVTHTTSDGVTITTFPANNMPRLYRVVIYGRVSTMHGEQLGSLKTQMEAYRSYVQRQRAWILVGEYVDVKSARSIHARDQFEKMIADCMDGKIDIIVTKTVSRFGRNTEETLSVLRELKERDVAVFFEMEDLHSNNGKDELLISVMAAVAQAEGESRSQNIKWGIEWQAQNPNARIYTRPCFGYRRAEDGSLIICNEEADTVQLIFTLYLQGASVLGIKHALEERGIKTPTGKDAWARRTIETILANEKYAGDVIIYKTYCAKYPDRKRIKNKGQRNSYAIDGNNPAIITKEQFEEVQKERLRRSNIVVDEYGSPMRKSTHYSMKKPSKPSEDRGEGGENV